MVFPRHHCRVDPWLPVAESGDADRRELVVDGDPLVDPLPDRIHAGADLLRLFSTEDGLQLPDEIVDPVDPVFVHGIDEGELQANLLDDLLRLADDFESLCGHGADSSLWWLGVPALPGAGKKRGMEGTKRNDVRIGTPALHSAGQESMPANRLIASRRPLPRASRAFRYHSDPTSEKVVTQPAAGRFPATKSHLGRNGQAVGRNGQFEGRLSIQEDKWAAPNGRSVSLGVAPHDRSL